MDKETVLMVTGGILSAIAIVVFVLLHRFYKHIGRRCSCGEMWKNYHTSRILFPPGENFVPRVVWNHIVDFLLHPTKEGYARFRQHFKWWRRDAYLITYMVCPVCKEAGKPHIRVVTFSQRPVSIWHLLWVKIRRSEEFKDSPELHFVFLRCIFEVYKKDGRPQVTEEQGNPDFQITLGNIKF